MYYDVSGKKQFDFNYSREEGRYRRSVPSTFPTYLRKKKVSTDRSNLRGKVCPSCGITRSMTNLCDCNS
jgi:hypothetical protein